MKMSKETHENKAYSFMRKQKYLKNSYEFWKINESFETKKMNIY